MSCENCKCECILVTNLRCVYAPNTPLSAHVPKEEVEVAIRVSQDMVIKSALKGCFDDLCEELTKVNQDSSKLVSPWKDIFDKVQKPIAWYAWYYHYELFGQVEDLGKKGDERGVELTEKEVQYKLQRRESLAQSQLEDFKRWLWRNRDELNIKCINRDSCCCGGFTGYNPEYDDFERRVFRPDFLDDDDCDRDCLDDYTDSPFSVV